MDKKRQTINKVMTVKEVSDFLKIPLSTIYDLVQKGKIRGVKFGKHWRFLEEDILAYFRGPMLESSAGTFTDDSGGEPS